MASSALPVVRPIIPSDLSHPLSSPTFCVAFDFSLTAPARPASLSIIMNKFTNCLQFLVLEDPCKIASVLSYDTTGELKFLLGARPTLNSSFSDLSLPDLYTLLIRGIYEKFHRKSPKSTIMLQVGWKSITKDGIRQLLAVLEKNHWKFPEDENSSDSTPPPITSSALMMKD